MFNNEEYNNVVNVKKLTIISQVLFLAVGGDLYKEMYSSLQLGTM